MEIFSNSAGWVTAIEGDVTPLLLEIGDDPVEPGEDDVGEPSANWKGYRGFRAIITGFGIQQQGGYQFLHTLRDFIYVYVFGERISQLTIQGLAFNASCDHPFDTDDISYLPGTQQQYHGLEWVQSYYLENRITNRPDPIAIVLGLDTPFLAFLTAMKFEVLAMSEQPFLGHFAMAFHVIPGYGTLVDDVVDDFSADEVLGSQLAFTRQLQLEARSGLQPGPER